MSKRNRDKGSRRNKGTGASGKNRNDGTHRPHKNRTGGINRQHKDRLFKALFGSPQRKELTFALYNAMNGSSYTDPEAIELSTIDDVVYMGMRNDVSFLFEQTMNVWEQQSTRNPNMPLRFLLYYAHVMERYVHELPAEEGDIFSSEQVRLPALEPVLFYNGPGSLPEYLHLSDAYPAGTKACVEMHIRVININSGQNRILELCQPLQDYTTFVETFRVYRAQEEISDREAASRAIADLNLGVVRSYLMAHKAEVIDMLLTEYDEQKTLKAEYCAGERAGVKIGRKAAQEEALLGIMRHAAKKTVSIAAAVEMAADYGVADEADFRKRASEQGIQLPE